MTDVLDRWRDASRLSLSTLTALPVPGPLDVGRRTVGRAMELAPAVGALLVVLVGLPVYLLRTLGLGYPPAAALLVAGTAALTRGLHLDGLADTADGLGASREPDRTREVMKGPEVGAFGVTSLVLVVVLQVSCLASCLAQHRGTLSYGLAVVTGRLAIAAACTALTAATAGGLGAMVACTARRTAVGAATATVLVLGPLLLAGDPDALGPAGGRALLGVLAVLAGLAAAALLLRVGVRRAGGLTGDLLGASSEVATTAALVVLALSPWS